MWCKIIPLPQCFLINVSRPLGGYAFQKHSWSVTNDLGLCAPKSKAEDGVWGRAAARKHSGAYWVSLINGLFWKSSLPSRRNHFKVYWGMSQAGKRRFLKWIFPHFSCCCGLSVYPPNSYVELLTSKDDGIRRCGLPEGSTLLNGLFKRGSREILQPFYHVRWTWKGSSPDLAPHAGALLLDF